MFALSFIARYWPHLLGVGLLALLAVMGYRWAYGNGYSAANARAEKIIGEFAKAEAKAQEDARIREQEILAGHHAAAQKWETQRDEIEAERDALAGRIAAGNQRLQPWWECPASGVPDTAGAAAVADEVARLRAESAARAVAAAEQCDAQIRGLQAVVRADRK